jgi:hypothetical protein
MMLWIVETRADFSGASKLSLGYRDPLTFGLFKRSAGFSLLYNHAVLEEYRSAVPDLSKLCIAYIRSPSFSQALVRLRLGNSTCFQSFLHRMIVHVAPAFTLRGPLRLALFAGRMGILFLPLLRS